MGLYDWLLFLHVAAAFVMVSAIVMLGAVVLGGRGAAEAGRSAALLRLSPTALTLWDIGGLTVLVFGVWLALNVPGYALWDPWIVAALVLWLVAAGAGGNLRRMMAEAVQAGAPPRAPQLYGVMAVATTLLLLVMIYKPGA